MMSMIKMCVILGAFASNIAKSADKFELTSNLKAGQPIPASFTVNAGPRKN
jgi:hypothetical protein